MRLDCSQQGLDGFGRHQRGRPPAKENTGHHAVRRQAGLIGKRAVESPHEAVLVDGFMAHMAVEIAIGAFCQTKGPVQIKAETRFVGAGLAVKGHCKT